MKKIWQKILKFFSSKIDGPKQETEKNLTDKIIQNFISHPEDLILFRGEYKDRDNFGGLHFTNNKEWAKSFGDILLGGTLPKGSIIHHIDQNDFTEAMGIYSRIKTMDDETIFKIQLDRHGYDAMVGHDPMNSNILDVVVNPKNLKYFKPLEIG